GRGEWRAAVQGEDREHAKRAVGVSGHLPAAEPNARRQPGRPGPQKACNNGVGAPHMGKKMTVGRYLLQLLAVRPAAFERGRTKITPVELDEEDCGIYVRMLVIYERRVATGIKYELSCTSH